MSRSFKKYGIIKDKGMSRGEYNRRFRRVNRQRIKEGKDPKLVYESTNQYEISDFKMRWERISEYHVERMMQLNPRYTLQKMKREYFNK